MGERDAIDAYIAGKVPTGRWADVSDIAEPILFLVSDRSSHMTGQVLVVDGGETVVQSRGVGGVRCYAVPQSPGDAGPSQIPNSRV